MRAAVYVRVSSDEQARGYSLDGQIREVRAYCEAQGYRVVRIYRDVGSGRKLERDAYQTMIHHGLQGKFDAVVVWRRDRFGRDVVHNTVVERELRRAGVTVEAIGTGRQEDTPEAHLMAHLLDAFAEHEARTIATRCQLGREGAARKGIWPARPPWGYVRNYQTKGLEIDEDKAPVIRQVFDLIIKGWNTENIAKATGLTRRRIEYMVRHPAYKGTCQYATVTTDGAWPGIVKPDVFQAANEAIDRRMADIGRQGATRASKVGVKATKHSLLGLEGPSN